MENKKWDEKSIAFERRGSEVTVLLEDFVPSVRCHGELYYASEGASVMVDGKKYFVDEIA